VIHPGVEIKPVEGDALLADRVLGQIWTHLGVEAVTVHAEVIGRFPQANEARQQPGKPVRVPTHAVALVPAQAIVRRYSAFFRCNVMSSIQRQRPFPDRVD